MFVSLLWCNSSASIFWYKCKLKFQAQKAGRDESVVTAVAVATATSGL